MRTVFSSYSQETPEDFRRKLDSFYFDFWKHKQGKKYNPNTGELERCNCDNCKFIHNIIDGTLRGLEPYQIIDIPDKKIYSKGELKKQICDYIEKEECYEAILFTKFLDNWSGNSFFLRYADLPDDLYL